MSPPSLSLAMNPMRFAKGIAALIFLTVVYSSIYYLYSDKLIDGGNDNKHDISAEIYAALLFRGDIDEIDKYEARIYGTSSDIPQKGFSPAITDRMPLYFLYLAIIKIMGGDHPAALHFGVQIALLLISLFLMLKILSPPCPALFMLIGGLLFSPYTIFQALIFEPHIPEVFLTCLGLWFYKKEEWFFAFFVATLSIFFHRGNIVLVGCIGLYHLIVNFGSPSLVLKAFAGGCCAWLATESFLFFLFLKDTNGILPHDYLVELLLFKLPTQVGSGMESGFAKAGLLPFWKNSLALMPIASVGLFWVRDRFQLMLTLAPLLIYFVLSGFNMPGAYRVLLPVYFLGYCYFIHHLMMTRFKFVRVAGIGLMTAALAMGGIYYSYVGRCLSLKDARTVKAGDSLGYRLHGNLSRFAPVREDGEILYEIKHISTSEPPNIPSPSILYTYFYRRLLSRLHKDGCGIFKSVHIVRTVKARNLL